ncbi:LLM class oxidoreductase [Lichenihabitans sp. Uapishka_5]|uniref:LLM class oxidoreductase n=1 Tax=Lichenihabitans sp. Uapishka_5 TaxID=3037302 RepID=UPI0029E825C8|nr:LLM class oxidoreductase [Lichenihabitans sp. Uapishka_5]MDX7949575.1 LLM class oxidoreductase [Lichenihabitans sp. Uapishka_5]
MEPSTVVAPSLPQDLLDHGVFAKVFGTDRLTLGLIAPIEAYPEGPMPTLAGHVDRVRLAEQAGFAAIWLRDIPFLDPGFGDAGQVFCPFAYAGYLAAVTSRISIGTAGIVLPLRNPIWVAKQATSVDQLLEGRFLLGLASGDRPEEYPALGVDFASRAELYRESVDIIKAVVGETFPHHRSQRYGRLSGKLDLVPKPVSGRIPYIAIGRAGQDLDWLASNVDAWIWYGPEVSEFGAIVPHWRDLSPAGVVKPYGYGVMFDLLEDPDAPLQPGRQLRVGRHALIELLQRHQTEGVSHVMLNMKPSRRAAEAVMAELAEHVIPLFPSL